MNLVIKYTGHPTVLEGFSDANWISDSNEMRATSGYAFTLAGGAVSWISSKQMLIIRSTMDVELVALYSAIVEAEWLRDLVSHFLVLGKPIPVVLVYYDNQAMIIKVQSRKDNLKTTQTHSEAVKVMSACQ